MNDNDVRIRLPNPNSTKLGEGPKKGAVSNAGEVKAYVLGPIVQRFDLGFIFNVFPKGIPKEKLSFEEHAQKALFTRVVCRPSFRP